MSKVFRTFVLAAALAAGAMAGGAGFAAATTSPAPVVVADHVCNACWQ